MKAMLQGRGLTRFVRLLAIGSFLALSLTVAYAGTTERVSVSSAGEQGNWDFYYPSITWDGRFVGFQSYRDNLVPGDPNTGGYFIRDRLTSTTVRIRRSGGDLWEPSISADGRYVVFSSSGDYFVAGDTNQQGDVYLYDRQRDVFERLSVWSDGAAIEEGAHSPVMSADARLVAFHSQWYFEVCPEPYRPEWCWWESTPVEYLRDRAGGTTEYLALQIAIGETRRYVWFLSPSLSADGRFVAFVATDPPSVIADDTNQRADIFVYDRLTGAVERVSVSNTGDQANGSSSSPAISGDGMVVAFVSHASNLVSGDSNGLPDVFVRDRLAGKTEIASMSTAGELANGNVSRPFISANGMVVAFASDAANLVPGDSNGKWDVFVHDRATSVTERVSVSSAGEQGDGHSLDDNHYVGISISGDGRCVAFVSKASNLVAGDTNGRADIFVRDRFGCPKPSGPLFGVMAVRQLTSWPDATLTSIAAGINYDGSRVAIESKANLTGENPYGVEEVFAVNGDGTGLRQLTHGVMGAKATWLSGNGEMICFQAPGNPTGQNPDGSTEVFVVSWDGSILRQLTFNPTAGYGCSSTRISHDGQWVCFVSNADLTGENPIHNTEAFVAKSDGTVLRQLTHEADARYRVSDSFISPDGQWIQFSSTSDPLGMNPDHSQEVFIINRYGTGVTQVTQNPDPMRRFEVSYGMTRDGGVLLIRGNANPTGQNPDGHDEAFIVNADGSGLRQLTCDPDFETGRGMLSYDGRLVSLRSRADFTGENPDHSWEVFLMKSDGSRITQISRYDGPGSPSVWDRLSGDGNRIAFTSNGNPTGGNPDLGMEGFIADLDTVPPTGLGISINGGARCTGRPDVTLSLTCNDCAEVRLRNDPGEWGPWEPFAATKAWTLTAGEGIKRVCAQGRDQGMNECAQVCDEILVYTLPPYYLAISINGGASCAGSREVTLTLAAMGPAEMRFRNESGAWSAWEPFVPTKVWSLSAGAGLKTVGFQCRDECGNVSAEATDTIRLATFEDVGCGDPSAPYIYGLVARRIASGCSVEPALFCPYAKITRAEAAVLICRAAGKAPLERATPTFPDVPKTHWAYGYIERFCDAESWGGNAPGYACSIFPKKIFCPGAAVRREQIAWIVCTAKGKQPTAWCSGTFADVPASNALCRWIERLADARSWPGGIAVTGGCACPSGYATGARCFCPKSSVTRGQMAVLLVRAFGISLW